MKEIFGDIWNFWKRGHWIVIPTNGSVRHDGKAVMGRGLARQAMERFPNLPKELGQRILKYGNKLFMFSNYQIITFPVKHAWFEKADLSLIEESTRALKRLDVEFQAEVCIPRVGCGNGKREWKEVKQILERYLDDRFIAVFNRQVKEIEA